MLTPPVGRRALTIPLCQNRHSHAIIDTAEAGRAVRGRVTAAIATAVVLALPAAGCAAPAGARPGTAGQRAAAVAGPGAPATAGGQGAPTRTPSAVARLCGPPDAPGHLIMVRAADGVRLAAVEAGAGERGVVLIPELG